MKTNLKPIRATVFFLLLLITALSCRDSAGEESSGDADNTSGLIMTDNDTSGVVRTSAQSFPVVTQKWLEGRVDLLADETTVGLISVEKTDVHWIPYYDSTFSLNLKFHDRVYFQLALLNVEKSSAKMAIAINIQKQHPDPGNANIICSGACIDAKWLEQTSFTAHGIYSHFGGGSSHKPGHIITKLTASSIQIQIHEEGVLKATETYAPVVIGYEGTSDKDNAYVPIDWISALDSAAVGGNKYFYIDYYNDKIDSRLVLRSFSKDHNHPGHQVQVTLRKQ